MKNNIQNKYISVFCDMYREKNPFKWVRRYFRQKKWARQRAVKGYADIDVYDIRAWFIKVMPSMLDQMAENAHGSPVYPCKTYIPADTAPNATGSPAGEEKTELIEVGLEEWREILHHMAQKFRDADEDTCSLENPYCEEWTRVQNEFSEGSPQWKDVAGKYMEKETEIAKFRQQSLDEAMELFHKWFWDLWV